MPTRRPARRPRARARSRVPVRRNRMSADIGEAMAMAAEYLSDALRYADDEGMDDAAMHLRRALLSLSSASMTL
jgi:hypothetical protein